MKPLQFTIGPVQGFVAQARTTRDMWAGSFLLSYLAGTAMLAVVKSQGPDGQGRIIFPHVHDDQGGILDPLLKAIEQVDRGQDPANTFISSLPNRFMAEIPDDFDPDACRQAVIKAWLKIANTVWNKYLEDGGDTSRGGASLGRNTREIWDRQVNGFWDIAWVVSDDPTALDWRKNWRSYVPTEEPGDKCMVMGNLQELSGYIRAQERVEQDKFWQELAQRVGWDLHRGQDLPDRLSVIAFIKRLFPKVGKEAVGWQLLQHYHSTAHMAAAHWIAGVMRAAPDRAAEFAKAAAALEKAKGTGTVLPESEASLQLIAQASESMNDQVRAFAGLDADCYYHDALENRRLWPGGTEKERQDLRDRLKELPGRPNKYYALLVMDGDNMGALLRDFEAKKVSQLLQGFTKEVDGIVRRHNGMTIYAGGDDVLALLPMEDALAAACDLRDTYRSAFSKADATTKSHIDPRPLSDRGTISAAIVYADYRLPLRLIVQEGHYFLDEIAKAKTGRDSLAVTVWKGSGRALSWSAPWDVVGRNNGYSSTALDDLVKRLGQHEYSSSFFFKLREQFGLFNKQETERFLPRESQAKVLTAEYLKAWRAGKTKDDTLSLAEATDRVSRLLDVCRQSWRDQNGNVHRSEGELKEDGALLIRFLAQKGVDR